jgi:hypothetical protein
MWLVRGLDVRDLFVIYSKPEGFFAKCRVCCRGLAQGDVASRQRATDAPITEEPRKGLSLSYLRLCLDTVYSTQINYGLLSNHGFVRIATMALHGTCMDLKGKVLIIRVYHHTKLYFWYHSLASQSSTSSPLNPPHPPTHLTFFSI